MRLKHKAELECSAEDIVSTVSETSKGKHKMVAREWNMLIGLTNPQIINATGIPHSTVWRWTRKLGWITTWKGKKRE